VISRQYRSEIDGIRTIAVLSVILFHFEFKLFSGGFVGVDIFFVISGFLITQNIVVDFYKEKFSLKSFYIKRVRRLFPALFTVLLLTIFIAFFLFSPEHYERLSKSLIYSLFSISNFFFWTESGYFDTSVNFKAFLHTWSLSVEEQYYLLWPIILSTLLLFKKKIFIIIFLVVSLVASLLFSEFYLLKDPNAVFYLMPFRIAEFAIGGLLVFVIDYQSKLKNVYKELLIILGLLLIAFSIFYYDKETSFPGYSVLIPSIGTALLIYAGNSKYLGFLLKNKISIFYGVESRINKKINNLFKDSKKFHIDEFGGNGFIANDFEILGEEKSKDLSFYLIGDSYALQYAYGMDKVLNKNSKKAYMLGDHGCIIGPDITRLIKGKPDISCAKQFNKILEKVKNNSKPIILVQYWGGYRGLIGTSLNEKAKYYDVLLDNISKMKEMFGDRKIILVGSQPGSGYKDGVINCLKKPRFFKNKCIDNLNLDQKKGKGLFFNSRL